MTDAARTMSKSKASDFKLVKGRFNVNGHVRGAFGKLLAWSFISVRDLKTQIMFGIILKGYLFFML